MTQHTKSLEEMKKVLKLWLQENVAECDSNGEWYGFDTNVGNLLEDECIKPLTDFLASEKSSSFHAGQMNVIGSLTQDKHIQGLMYLADCKLLKPWEACEAHLKVIQQSLLEDIERSKE
jgi:hypothetical protein